MKKQYAKKYEELLQEETKALSDIRAKDAALSVTEKWLDAIKKYQKIPSIDCGLLELLVARIEISEDRTIKIILNYEDPTYSPLSFFKSTELLIFREISLLYIWFSRFFIANSSPAVFSPSCSLSN